MAKKQPLKKLYFLDANFALRVKANQHLKSTGNPIDDAFFIDFYQLANGSIVPVTTVPVKDTIKPPSTGVCHYYGDVPKNQPPIASIGITDMLHIFGENYGQISASIDKHGSELLPTILSIHHTPKPAHS